MDRYFYAIELDTDGNKTVHLSGNVYYNDADETETNYRHAEWVYFYISIDELKNLISNDLFYEYVNERVHYLCDIDKEDALKICKYYWNGSSGINLHIQNVSSETACGEYWFDAGCKYDKRTT